MAEKGGGSDRIHRYGKSSGHNGQEDGGFGCDRTKSSGTAREHDRKTSCTLTVLTIVARSITRTDRIFVNILDKRIHGGPATRKGRWVLPVKPRRLLKCVSYGHNSGLVIEAAQKRNAGR